jgi:hypothetical protein
MLVLGHVLSDNLGFSSVAGILAIGSSVCLLAIAGLVIDHLVRSRNGRRNPLARYELAIGGLLVLIGSVAIGVFMPLRGAEGCAQHSTVEALQEMGCSAYYDYLVKNDGHSDSKGLSWVPRWLLSLAGEDFFHRVVRVDLNSLDPNVDEVLPHLRSLTGLKYVVLSTDVTPCKIRQIERGLPSCEIKYTTMLGVEFHPWPLPPIH